MSHAEQQKQFDKIAEELSRTNDLWTQDDFGGVSTGPTSHSHNAPDFGGMVNEEKVSLRPKDFTAADLEELAKRDPRFKRKLDDQKIKDVADAFMAANPSYVRSDRNFEEILKYLRRHILKNPVLDLDEVEDAVFAAGAWTIETLTQAFEHLEAQGRLEMPAETAKELSSEERLSVIAKIRAGNPGAAIILYLKCALPKTPLDDFSVERFTCEYPQLMHKVAWEIFREMHPELTTDEFRDFYQSLKGKALPTIPMLESALNLRREDRYLGSIAGIVAPAPTPSPAPAPPSPEQHELTEDEIRALPTEELEKLIAEERKATIRQLYRL